MSLRTRSHRRVPKAFDSGSENEDDYDQKTPARIAEEKKRNAAISQLNDLGSDRRDFITAVDKGRQPFVNVQKLHADRDCNQPGTDAAKKAATHRTQLNAWANYGDTGAAKTDNVENLSSIADGNAHRENTRAKLAAEGVQTLQDTYDDRRRPRGIPPARMSRGGPAATTNDRGHCSTSRGGGFASPGFVRGTATSSGNRPLDPAIDPGRNYAYRTGPAYKSEASHASFPTGTAKDAANQPPTSTQKAASTRATGKKETSHQIPSWLVKDINITSAEIPASTDSSSASLKQKDANKSLQSPRSSEPTSKPAAIPKPKPAPPSGVQAKAMQLADPNAFMAAANMIFPQAPPTLKPSQQSAVQPMAATAGPKKVPNVVPNTSKDIHSLSSITENDGNQIKKIPIRDFQTSTAGTDGMPSPGELSAFSASMHSQVALPKDTSVADLDVSATEKRNAKPQVIDFMSFGVPDVDKAVLVPTPSESASSKGGTFLSKDEAEEWEAYKAAKAKARTTKEPAHSAAVSVANAFATKEVIPIAEGPSSGSVLVSSNSEISVGGSSLPKKEIAKKAPSSLKESRWADVSSDEIRARKDYSDLESSVGPSGIRPPPITVTRSEFPVTGQRSALRSTWASDLASALPTSGASSVFGGKPARGPAEAQSAIELQPSVGRQGAASKVNPFAPREDSRPSASPGSPLQIPGLLPTARPHTSATSMTMDERLLIAMNSPLKAPRQDPSIALRNNPIPNASAIFGDGKNVARARPETLVEPSATKPKAFGRGIRRDVPGPGYHQLIQELHGITAPSAPIGASRHSQGMPDEAVKQAIASARTMGERFAVPQAEYDTDESEL